MTGDLIPSEQVVLRTISDLSVAGPVRTTDALHSSRLAKSSFYEALKNLHARGLIHRVGKFWQSKERYSAPPVPKRPESEVTACTCEASARLWFLVAPDGAVAGVGFSPLACLRGTNRTINKSVRLWAIRDLVNLVTSHSSDRYVSDSHVLQRVHVEIGHVHCGKGHTP